MKIKSFAIAAALTVAAGSSFADIDLSGGVGASTDLSIISGAVPDILDVTSTLTSQQALIGQMGDAVDLVAVIEQSGATGLSQAVIMQDATALANPVTAVILQVATGNARAVISQH